jgi:hypothetical protein
MRPDAEENEEEGEAVDQVEEGETCNDAVDQVGEESRGEDGVFFDQLGEIV